MTPRKSRISSARFAARFGLVELMTAFDSFPLGRPAFVSNILDRAAHLRSDDAKLLALEGERSSRAYVVYRDSLVVKQEPDGPRALLTIDEALKFGANPGTIFLGLRDGAAVFGMGISAQAVEKLLTRNDVAVSELRGMAMQGVVPPDQLSAIAMAKSMVSWLLRQLRYAIGDEGGRLEARVSELQGRTFPAHRSGGDHAGDLGR